MMDPAEEARRRMGLWEAECPECPGKRALSRPPIARLVWASATEFSYQCDICSYGWIVNVDPEAVTMGGWVMGANP